MDGISVENYLLCYHFGGFNESKRHRDWRELPAQRQPELLLGKSCEGAEAEGRR